MYHYLVLQKISTSHSHDFSSLSREKNWKIAGMNLCWRMTSEWKKFNCNAQWACFAGLFYLVILAFFLFIPMSPNRRRHEELSLHNQQIMFGDFAFLFQLLSPSLFPFLLTFLTCASLSYRIENRAQHSIWRESERMEKIDNIKLSMMICALFLIPSWFLNDSQSCSTIERQIEAFFIIPERMNLFHYALSCSFSMIINRIWCRIFSELSRPTMISFKKKSSMMRISSKMFFLQVIWIKYLMVENNRASTAENETKSSLCVNRVSLWIYRTTSDFANYPIFPKLYCWDSRKYLKQMFRLRHTSSSMREKEEVIRLWKLFPTLFCHFSLESFHVSDWREI